MTDVTGARRQEELRLFRSFAARSRVGNFVKEALGEDAFVLRSPSRSALRADRPIDMTLLALTHGNEVAGIAVLNNILNLIDRASISFNIDIAFVLGNVPAYLKDKRFEVTDLNRAFGRADSGNPEQVRARFLETVFRQSAFVIDYHQTQSRAETPFYISLFDTKSFLAFTSLMPHCDVVTYWEAAFSTDGMTTINYQIAKAGHGFGVELGTKGFDVYQIEHGVSIALKMLNAASTPGFLTNLDIKMASASGVYTWSTVVKSQSGEFALIPGLANMSVVTKGMKLGRVDGQDYLAEDDGRLLFPKYPATGERTLPGAEVCRILRRVPASEIVEKAKNGLQTL